MWYWILYLILAVWVLIDAKKRKNNFIGWAIGTVLFGPIVIPIYLSKRYLKEKETREGGTGWNVLKNFALLWTLTLFVAAIAGMIGAGGVINESVSEAEKAGAIIGTGLAMIIFAMLWFFPMAFALILGVFLKKSSVVETGPTGKLSEVNIPV